MAKWQWWNKYFGREREEKLRAINNRLDKVVANINGESKRMLKIEREQALPQVFECQEIKKSES